MKTTYLFLAAAAMILVPVNGQEAVSGVVGYYRQTIQPGNTAVVCGLTTRKDFQGAMSSNAPGNPHSVITQTGAGWTPNQFQTSAAPATDSSHFIEILSGTPAVTGLILDIVSNTANSVTVEGSTAVLAGNETYCVRTHVTLGSMLPGGGGLTAGADTLSIVNPNASIESFIYNGLNWENAGTLDDGTGKVIYPGQGFIIFRGGATPATLTFGGNAVSWVKYGPTKVPLYSGIPANPVRNMIGLINPLVCDVPLTPECYTPICAFGLVAALVPGSDTIDVFSKDGTFRIIHTMVNNGGNLEDVATLDDVCDYPVPHGCAIRVIATGNRLVTLPQTHPGP